MLFVLGLRPLPSSPLSKHTILFLAANPAGTDRRALDQEARDIQVELERSGFRDRFALETRWAVEPLDLLRELRKLKPTIVHFSGCGGSEHAVLRRTHTGPDGEIIEYHQGGAPQTGLCFQGADGWPRGVSAQALAQVFEAAGSSVQLIVLNACYSEHQAQALLAHVDHVVGTGRAIPEDAARSFAIGFYGGLGEGERVSAAYRQGCAAISLEGLSAGDDPQLRLRGGISADRPLLAERERAAGPEGERPPGPRAHMPAPAAKRAILGTRSCRRMSAIFAAAAAVGVALAVLAAVLAADGDDEPAPPQQPPKVSPEMGARLDEVPRRLAGLGDPPPPPACVPAIAAAAGELILTARDRVATDPNAAIAVAARAIERCPGWAAAHNVYGNALARANRLEAAVESYARALSLAPDYDAPRFNLGLVQLRLKDPAAIATFTELIQRKPELPDVYNARGKAHLFAKKYPEAVADLEEAVRRKPDDGIAWMLVGQLRERLALKDAEQAFCRAAELGVQGAAVRCGR